MTRRVVITGAGVVAPNGVGLQAFETAIRKGQSGLSKQQIMEDTNFGCHVAGVPKGVDEICDSTFDPDELMAMNMSHRFCSLAAREAWLTAGFELPPADSEPDWQTGAILGTGIGGMDTTGEKVVPYTDNKKIRRLGSTAVEQVMASGISARVSGQLALGNQVTTNSSACSTGTEAIIMGADRIRMGLAERMLCGGAEAASHYIWAGFDAMRVLCRNFNDEPEKASRPMSASAAGFIPGAGAGVLMVESLESAQERGAEIWGELIGTSINCGGHRGGGSMTAPNPESVQRCIQGALAEAGIEGSEVDVINGHLTATGADPKEIDNWSKGLSRGPEDFPMITATKSLIGHTLGAAGGIESVASILMLREGFVQPAVNCEDIHPEIEAYEAFIPREGGDMPDLKVIAKAGFGFGDVNACLILRKWTD
jgi:3-oxoacyl-(acyl-carrier-protein) synthase